MTVLKIKQHLHLVERRVNAFKIDRTKENLDAAQGEIWNFNRNVGITLWDELEMLERIWSETERVS